VAKSQKRSGREQKKPKQSKSKATVPATAFGTTPAQSTVSEAGKKK
jgi:hypothetical protein